MKNVFLNKKIFSFFFALLLLCESLVSCSGNSVKTDSTKTSTNEGPLPVYVIPTKYGENCIAGIKTDAKKALWNNGFLKKAIGQDNAYDMTIYSGDVSGKDEKGQYNILTFNTTGTNYSSSDIDVALFGIGTNYNNSYNASTVLYANTSNDSTAETGAKLVTGVEYANGTGPIKNVFDERNEYWIRTSVLEQQANGIYTQSKSYETTYTHVYITLKDSIPPRLANTEFEIEQERLFLAEDKLEAIKGCVGNAISRRYRVNYDGIDRENDATLESLTIGDDVNLDNLKGGDSFSFKLKLRDYSENVSDEYDCTMDVVARDPQLMKEYYRKLSCNWTAEEIKENIAKDIFETPYYFDKSYDVNILDGVIGCDTPGIDIADYVGKQIPFTYSVY